MHPERANRKQPPSLRHEGHHSLSPNLSHDDYARLDFQMTSNFFVAQTVFSAAKKSWEYKQRYSFINQFKRDPVNRQEVREIMKKENLWKLWSSLKRNNQEMSYHTRGEIISREEKNILHNYKSQKKIYGKLKLNSKLNIPRYITKVDIHCMPNGYNADNGESLFAGSNYDTASLYLATGGELGKYSDGAGWANIAYIKKNFPEFKPKKILDLGCSVGHSTIPFKIFWPEAEVHAIDACASLLKFAYSRSNFLRSSINFHQQNAEFTEFDNNDFDLVASSMFLHEIPQKNLSNIGKEIYRILKPGGLMLHNEQPQYHGQAVEEQFFREWDTWYNNEPMRCAFRDMDLKKWVKKSRFCVKKFHDEIAPGAKNINGKVETDNKGFWFIFSAMK